MDHVTDCPTSSDCGGLPTELRSSLVARTRSLFALLTTACGGSRRIAAQEIMVDPRCCDHLRNAPTIDFIARIGHGLGLDASSASGVVAAEPSLRSSRETILDAMARADLVDDALQTARLAAELQRRAEVPTDLGLAQLAYARSCMGCGNLDGALAAMELVRRLGISRADAAVARQMTESIIGEASLGAPWTTSGVDLSGLRALLPASSEATGGSVRARCWSLGARLRADPAPTVNDHALHGLLRALDEASDPIDVGWAGSIAAETALLLRREGRCSGLRAIVTCELALEQALAVTDGAVRDHLLRRRTRIALREWCTRAVLGEIDVDTIDHLDAEELARIAMWFPLALCEPVIGRVVERAGERKFTKINRQGIDTLSMHDWMSGQVRSLHATGAVADSRSEDPC